MKTMNQLLDDVEPVWRREVNRDYPLRADTPVIKERKISINRDWEFSTDLKKIFAIIENDKNLQKKFKKIISKYWTGNPEELARETLHYLLFHELYHPIEAPFSVKGEDDDNDNKKIHQSIRRGILRTEPNLSPLEQVIKVQASQNGVKDFILDNRFSLDNKKHKYVREDIIPTWDVLELHDAPAKTNFYTITRFIYGILYGPESVYDFFGSKTGKKGVKLAEQSLKALLEKDVKLSKEKKSLLDKAKSLLRSENIPNQETRDKLNEYIKEIREVFSGEDRYKGIERFMAVLGPYIEKDMPQGRPDQQGAGSGTSPQNILQDLLDDMTLEEQQEFVSELTEQLENGDLEQFSDGEADSITDFNSSNEEMNTLDLFAIHEFYKRNHPNVHIIGGKKIGEKLVVGKQNYWKLTKSNVITEDELCKLNLEQIARFQKKTRLPMLIPLQNKQYRLNEYTLKQRDLKDIVYVDAQVDVPDIVEFYLDSSGSMYQNCGNLGFNDDSRWDMLSNVVYGFIDALYQGSRTVKKPCSIQIHNFGNSQVSSEIIPVEQFWKANTDTLGILFKPHNGYSVEDINIKKTKDNQKRAYVIVTDGNLVISGRTKRESRKMKELAQNPNNEVVLFEMGGTYDLGNAVKNDSNIHYYPVYDKDEMLRNGLEVLLSK